MGTFNNGGGDSLTYHNGRPFSTIDNDNDAYDCNGGNNDYNDANDNNDNDANGGNHIIIVNNKYYSNNNNTYLMLLLIILIIRIARITIIKTHIIVM